MQSIDKNVPVPSRDTAGGRRAKYPFSKMSPGDSVFFEGATTTGREYRAAISMGSYKKWKFTARVEDGGLRIWRIA